MQFGICCSPTLAIHAAGLGFDYFESPVAELLKPREDEAAFQAALRTARESGLPCQAANVFVPADLKITGPAADLSALERFVSVAFRRAEEAGVQVIVFGSGGARRIPDGFERSTAWEQIAAFCRGMAPLAEKHGVTVAVEPLNRAECNVLTTVAESARLVRQVDHPALRLLVDAYHLLKDGDSLEDVVANADLLAHVHVATLPNRLAPALEECDLSPFFQALRRAGYHGRISFEGNLPGDWQDLRKSLAWMRNEVNQ